MPARKIPSKQVWINQIFKAKAAKKGGIVRRSVDDVKKFGTIKALKEAVKAHGFHMIRIEGQFVIICSEGRMKVEC